MYLKRKSGNFLSRSVGHSMAVFLMASKISATDALLARAPIWPEGVGELFPLFALISASTRDVK